MGKKILPLMLAGCIFLGGCALLAYPRVSQRLNGLHQSEVIADYSSAVDGLDDEEAETELRRAADYNRELTDTVSLTDPFENKLEENDQYPTLLNFTAEGVMGYIEIPKINVLLPIYHGVSSGVLSKGIGHLPETSLPVGGTSTHCVLAGHSGMSNARLFTDLPKLENGDVFYLHIYNKTLTYEICLRLSEAQAQELRQDAKACGLSKTAYLRRLIERAELKARPSQELRQLRTEIHHIGNNVNQLARKFNAGFGTKGDAQQVRYLMEQIYDLLYEISKE